MGQSLGHIVGTKEVPALKHREFIYVGNPIPDLDQPEHADFLLNVQKAILYSLEKRKFLTLSQRLRCIDELEKKYIQSQKEQRRA